MYINKVSMMVSERILIDEKFFRCSEEVAQAQWLRDLMLSEDKEKFVCIHLDVKNRMKSFEVVSIGSLSSSIAHPREVLRGAILAGSFSVILAHNHPSGDPEPSMDDIEITNRLCKGFGIIGINLLDHVILSNEGWFSFRMKNMI